MLRAVSRFLVLLSFVAVGAASAQDGKFVYKQEPFDEAIYRTTAKLSQSQTIAGMKIATEFNTTEVSRRSCEEIDKDGNFKVRLDNKALHVKGEISMLGTYEYDSKKTERESGTMLAGALNPVFDCLNGGGYSYMLTPRGEVTKVTGFADLFGDSLKENQVGAQFAGGGSDEAARTEIMQKYVHFPDKALSPGDTWEHDYAFTLPGIGKIKGRRSYKYAGDETKDGRKLAKVTFTDSTTVEVDLKSDVSTAKGTLTTSSSSGEALFDAEAGRVVSLSNKAELAGSLSISVGGMDLTIDQTQTQEAKVELLDKLP